MAVSTDKPEPRTLEDVLDGLLFAMVSTSAPGGDGLARPLTLLELDAPLLRFLVSREAEWVAPLLADEGPVQVSFADPSENTYVSVAGLGRVVRDEDLIERLWNPAAGAYFDGRDDPAIAVLEVEVVDGEWWDGPSSKVGQALSMVRTKVTGSASGDDHGPVTA
jgi:general stress protein 26